MPFELTTPFQLKRLDEKILYLEKRLADVSAEAATAAESFGDLIDNAEFEYAIKREDLLTHQLNDLISQRREYIVIGTDKIDLKSVAIGTSIQVLNKNTQQSSVYNIVGSGPIDMDQNEVSYKSPIGQALYGAKIGESRKAVVPIGTLDLLVVGISKYTH